MFFILCAQAGKAVVSFSKVRAPARQVKMLVGRAELHSNMGSEQWRGSCCAVVILQPGTLIGFETVFPVVPWCSSNVALVRGSRLYFLLKPVSLPSFWLSFWPVSDSLSFHSGRVIGTVHFDTEKDLAAAT